MNQAYELISSFKDRGVRLWLAGEKLRYRVAEGTLSTSDIALLKLHKGIIIDALRMVQASIHSPIVSVPRNSQLPLSFAQQRLWFLSRIEGASDAYHVPCGARLRGRLNKAALRQALDLLVARHESLRTRFELVDGSPVQQIDAADTGFSLEEFDLEGCGDWEQVLRDRIKVEAQAPFEMEKGPLCRGQLIQIKEDDCVLLITMHHIISDGWSQAVIYRDIGELYKACVAGEENPLVPLAIQYVDYAVWQHERLNDSLMNDQTTYWRDNLSGAPTLLTLPMDRNRPASQDFNGDTVYVELDEVLTSDLKAISKRYGLTLYVTIMAAWALVLHKLSGTDDIVIGSPSANRSRVEIESLVGFFVNTLAMRIDLSGDPTVGELFARVLTTTLGAQANQDLPFERIVDVVRPPRSLAHGPIFQVAFAWQSNEQNELELSGLDVEMFGETRTKAKFDLLLDLTENDGMISGVFEYATTLFDRETIERIGDYLRAALAEMVSDPKQKVSTVSLLSSAEQNRLLVELNAVDSHYASAQCIHELFEFQAQSQPDALALVFENQKLSYAQLNARSNRLARYLRTMGVVSESLVAICVEPSIEMVVGLLAILKAGGAYVPMDPAYPAERLAFMLEDAGVSVVLTHAAAAETLDTALQGFTNQPFIIDLLVDAPQWAELSCLDLMQSASELGSEKLAYVIYTSGSTGRPKGVLVEHRNVVRLFSATRQQFEFDHLDVWTLFHSFAFDFSVWEIWGALLHGGQLVVVPRIMTRSPQEFYKLIGDSGVTVLNQTPTAFRSLLAAQAESRSGHCIRTVVFGGEALDIPSLKPWYEDSRNLNATLVNMYGITETTVHVTYKALSAEETYRTGVSPIGKRIADLQIYILDKNGSPVPQGVTGEIYVGGAGVARGYLNRPELNKQRFIPNQFKGGETLYRTGDLGRYAGDGEIEYLGRNDHQVKIRGFRIELGEIEACLASYPGLRDTVVLVQENAVTGRRLVAYYTKIDLPSRIDVSELREHLVGSLPVHMVPAEFVELDAFPLTTNGKLDKQALLLVSGRIAQSADRYEAPQGVTECALADIWEDVLGVEKIGRNDNFFELGGHSLLAVRVLERMTKKGLNGDVRSLYSALTLKQQARSLSPENVDVEVPPVLIEDTCTAITPDMLPLVTLTQEEIDRVIRTVDGGISNIQDIYPLAPLQEGILFHHLLSDKGDPYVFYKLFSFSSRARLDSYLEAINKVIARHDILRTAIVWEAIDKPVQVVWRHAALVLEEEVFDDFEPDVAERLKLKHSPREHRMDITKAPMKRLIAAEDKRNGGWIAMLLVHHLIDDNTSMKIFDAETTAFLSGSDDRMAKPLPFRNFIAQVGMRQDKALQDQFFRTMLGDVDEPTVAFGVQQVNDDTRDTAEEKVLLGADLNDAIRSCGKLLGVSPASIFHAAWALVLSSASGRDNPVFGTVLFGRMGGTEGADRVMGLFINTLPICLPLGSLTAEQCIRQTQATLAELMRHEHASLSEAQQLSSLRPSEPLFTSLLNYRHSSSFPKDDNAATQAAWQGIVEIQTGEITNYPLTLSIDDLAEDFQITVFASGGVAPERVCDMVRVALDELTKDLAASSKRAINTVCVLPPSERSLLLEDQKGKNIEFANEECVQSLFETQVERDPGATALVCDGHLLTYQELNIRANQLAHQLREIGVVADSPVALCMERSPAMIVAMLAILKAGGAYVTLDPSYPSERLAYILMDSQPVALLIHNATGAIVTPAMDVSTVPNVLNLDEPVSQSYARTNPCPSENGLASTNLCYITYTSGSTGRPKGVMVEHRNLAHLIAWHVDAFSITSEDHCSHLAGLGFDATAWEIWPSLASGAQLHLPPHHLSTDVEALLGWWSGQTLSVSFLPTPLAELALTTRLAPVSLRTLLVGGDTFRGLHSNKPSFDVINNYGPTETTVVATSGKVDITEKALPIGSAISNTRIYLLNGQLQLVPLGVIGEIFIGGAGVARGYLNQPEQNLERFISDPFNQNERLFRSGDLGRFHADGSIEFLGRNDNQVKIRGFRIEPGEIEARLTQYPEIMESAVLAREDGSGEKQLIAYYSLRERTTPIDIADLREHLTRHLPNYMLPATYIQLDRMPLTPNGKFDRRAMPMPDKVTQETQACEAPVGPVEETLAGIWQDLLGVHQSVDRNADFFNLGGHSLLAMRLVERVRQELNAELTLGEFLSHSTPRSLSDRLGSVTASMSLGLIPLSPWNERKELILFMPSILGSGLHLRALAQCFSQEFDVATLQLPGFQLGEKPCDTVEAMADACIDHLNEISYFEHITLVGWSFGGALAFETAQNLKPGTASAVLIDTLLPSGYNSTSQSEKEIAVAVDEIVSMLDMPTLNPEEYNHFYSIYRAHYQALEQYSPSLMTQSILEILAKDTVDGLTDKTITGSRVSAYRDATVVVEGDHSSIVAPENIQVLYGLIMSFIHQRSRPFNANLAPLTLNAQQSDVELSHKLEKP